ncbi:MAG: ribonuclease P [Candidatus Altiarchaeales archaeon HGW-Altiarchaeales-3]|nr:MAG: ribonuclease P [Candidatus Altiarchaeales archaeon HGW-Altiarchaeales-3]
MSRKIRKNKLTQKKIADERIKILLEIADARALNKNFDSANRYVTLARKIAMKYNARIKGEFKRKFCKFCYNHLMPGATSKVRLNSSKHRVEVKCFGCGKVMFYPYVREIKKRRVKLSEMTDYKNDIR